MACLTALPPEILHLVLDQLPLSSHFEFACTTKSFALVFRSLLQRHQDAHRKYRVVSDRDPGTVPFLLQSVFDGDPIPAWHVRGFEVWRDRMGWEEWAAFGLDGPPAVDLTGGVSDLDILGFRDTLSRVGGYIDVLGMCLEGGVKREKALKQIEYGSDGVLKALLFAALPRLGDLKFVTRSQDTGSTLSWLKVFIGASKGARPESAAREDASVRSCEEDGPAESKPVQRRRVARETWMGDEDQRERLAYYAASSPTEDEFNRQWDREIARWNEEQTLLELGNMELFEPEMGSPDASDALMDVCEDVCEDVCVPDTTVDLGAVSTSDSSSDNVVDATLWPPGFLALRSVAVGVVSETWMDDPEYPKSSALVARLLRLPNINTLYLNGLQHDDNDDVSENDVDSDAGSDWEENEWSIFDFTSSVQHLFFEGMSWELDADTREWLCCVPRKLLTIGFRDSGPDAGDIQRASRIVDDLAEAQGPSLQSLMWYGFDKTSLEGSASSILDFSEDNALSCFDDLRHVSCNVEDFATALFDCDDGGDGDCAYVDFIATACPESLEHLVLWGDADSGPCRHGNALERAVIRMIQSKRYKHLKAIHLEQVQRATDGGDALAFEEAVAVGKAAGVDVFTRTNRSVETGADFPRAVNWYDLRTGKCPDGVPGWWVFDSYSGVHEPRC